MNDDLTKIIARNIWRYSLGLMRYYLSLEVDHDVSEHRWYFLYIAYRMRLGKCK